MSHVLSGKNALIALFLLHSFPVSLLSSCQGSDVLKKLKGRKFSLEDRAYPLSFHFAFTYRAP